MGVRLSNRQAKKARQSRGAGQFRACKKAQTRLLAELRVETGALTTDMLAGKIGRFSVLPGRYLNNEHATALLFAGGKMEIVFYDTEPVAFRRKEHVYFNRDLLGYYGAPLARSVVYSLSENDGTGLADEEFRLRLIDNLIIGLKRTMAPHDVVAESSQFSSAISKALDELLGIANSTTEDADAVRERVLDARMRLFTRMMGLDKRRKPDGEV